MRAAVEAARAFLDRDLDDARERLAQDLEAGQSLLAERVKRAVERAKHDLDQTLSRWERMHHKTIQAVCRRGGAHVGTHRNDFPADLSKPILDGIAFAWSDFFGEKLRQTLERWTDRLVRHVASYREQLGKKVAEADDVSPSVVKNLDGIFETTTKIVQEVLAQTHNQTDTKILHEQRTLYEAIPDQVKANMQSAFMKAAEEKGAGMKSRMVAILGQHAHKVSQVMFDDARDALVNGVRSLNDWLIREYETMIQAVQRNASLAAENLVVSGERMTADAMAAEQAIVTNLQELLTELVQTPTE